MSINGTNGTASTADCGELPSWGFAIGVLMGCVGSIGINIGQNIQASGLQALPELERVRPCQSRKHNVGLGIFVSFSMLNFSALALAPASICTPLESIQFVTNIFWNKFVNDAVVSRRMVSGVGLAVAGTGLSVAFGASSSGCHTLEELAALWSDNGIWWAYLTISNTVAVASYTTYKLYVRRLKQVAAKLAPAPLPHHRLVMPITYTLGSALAGGAQMIVHSKVLAEILALLVSQGDTRVFTHWLLYVELALVAVCGVIWVVKLTQCLGLFDPLLILPLMVGSFILFGGIAVR